jgi:hypothetical protein
MENRCVLGLWGSLPSERVFEREHITSGEAFVAWDRLLDTARTGPFYLRQAEIASIVQEQLQKIDTGGLCSLHAFVIMPNHVHLLCTPSVSIAELVRRVKGPTAHLANLLLGRTGQKNGILLGQVSLRNLGSLPGLALGGAEAPRGLKPALHPSNKVFICQALLRY